jgi:hypothetical protein
MSRSRKHIACCGMVAKDRGAKKRFNRRIRRARLDRDFCRPGDFRRANETWEIEEGRDHHATYEGYRDVRKRLGEFKDERSCREEFEKQFLRK